MPETAIGLFPDVGGSYFLPRLDNDLGVYLGVTGAKLTGEQLVQAGIATHFVPKESIGALRDSLIEHSDENSTAETVKQIIQPFTKTVEGALPNIQDIERDFKAGNSIEHLHYRLDEDHSDWAQKKLRIMEKLSPLSQHIVFQQLKKGKNMSLEEVFLMEYRLS